MIAESDRGAVLIATELVAEQLELLFRATAPADMSVKRVRAILECPGVLSGLAAKIDIGLMCGLFGARLGNALHALRRLRNDCAHSAQAFRLRDRWQDYRKAFALGDGLPEWINRTVLEVTMKGVVARLQEIRMPNDLGGEPAFKTPDEVLKHLEDHPDLLADLGETMPRRELAVATAMMCGLVILHREHRVEHRGEQAGPNKIRPERDPDPEAE